MTSLEFRDLYRRHIGKMKRFIYLFLALCLMAGCAPAGAESRVFEGKPYPNSNLYGQWPSERPGPETSFDLYANFDFLSGSASKRSRR